MAKALTILFSDRYEETGGDQFFSCRPLASEPFGGRYRLIDFFLSSLINSQLYRVGILTKERYGSLMDHVGWGKDWDLNRRGGGLQILAPFVRTHLATPARNEVEALLSARTYIEDAKEDLLIVGYGNLVANIDFEEVLRFHENRKADITILYANGREQSRRPLPILIDSETGRITDDPSGTTDYTPLQVFVFDRKLFLKLLAEAETYRFSDVSRDFVIRNLQKLRVFAYEQKGFCRIIRTVEEYYAANMAILDRATREGLFPADKPVLTRVKNSAPTYYGFESHTENSLVADGCTIEGNVKNCIIFRNVTVEKGAHVENSILMQGCRIGADSRLSCVIADKDVTVGKGRVLSGYTAYPFVIEKGSEV